MGQKHLSALSGCLLFIMMAFKADDILHFVRPDHFPQPVYNVQKYPVTKAGFELGKMLFYETALSRDNKISCGSCHIQSAAFTQHGHDVSHGIDDRLGSRNSPPIMNLAWSNTLFWDGGVFHLDLLPISPITNPVEMDETMENVLRKLNQLPGYRARFKNVFGSETITGTQVFKALSQFMLMCVSANSKYDSVARKLGPVFTAKERQGYLFFRRNCGGCHKEPLFTDGSFRYNGLDNTFNNDSGRVAITLDPADRYRFKVPSLRNLSYTAPYMHDGRFNTIDEVIAHYTSGVKKTGNLDPLLLKQLKPGIPMTANDKINLKAFLKTLDDKVFVTRKDLGEFF